MENINNINLDNDPDKIIKSLTSKMMGGICPLCGRRDWNVDPQLCTLVNMDKKR